LTVRTAELTNARPDILHAFWYSHAEQIERRVDIFVPETLRSQPSESPVPVLYLLHGINGYEGSWQDLGGAADTLEAMITSGRCQPMILVMPDCNKWPFKERPTHHRNLWKCVFHYGKLCREHQLEEALSDLMDMIDSSYLVSDCAVAGLSDGGRMSANLANRRPDRVRAVGLFSPVLRKDQLPQDTTQRYAVYIGKQDFLKGSGKRFHRRMTKQNFPHRFIELDGKHTWPMWQRCLSDFIENLSADFAQDRLDG